MLLVIGAQRSGTRTMANMLGIRHEKQFNYEQTNGTIAQLLSGVGIKPESSWMIMPFFKLLCNDPLIKFVHVIRHPLNVVASLQSLRAWDDKRLGHYQNFVYKYLPGMKTLTDPIEKSLYYWYYWNKMPHKEVPRLQIEALQNIKIYNKGTHYPLTWADVPDTPLKQKVETLAQEFNYGF